MPTHYQTDPSTAPIPAVPGAEPAPAPQAQAPAPQASTEDIDLTLPTGEEVTLTVPTGWSDQQIKEHMIAKGIIAPPTSFGDRLSIANQEATPTNAITALTDPAKRAFNVAIYEWDESARWINEAATGKTAEGDIGVFGKTWRTVLGLGRAAFVPLAAAGVFAGRVVENAVRDTTWLVTGNKKLAEGLGSKAGSVVELGAVMFGPGATTKAIKSTVDAINLTPEAIRAMQAAKAAGMSPGQGMSMAIKAEAKATGTDPKPLYKALEGVTDRIDPATRPLLQPKGAGIAYMNRMTQLKEEVLSQRAVDSITESAGAALAGNYDKSKRVSANIFKLLETQQWAPADIKIMLQQTGMTPAQLAQEYKHVVHNSGHILWAHSRVAKQLKKVFEGDPKATAHIEELAKKNPELFGGNMLLDWANRATGSAINFWRSMLTTQLGTAMRNAASGGAHLGFETIASIEYDLLAAGNTILRTGNFAKAWKQALTSLNAAVETGVKMTPESRIKLMQILESPEAMEKLYKMRLLSQPLGDLQLTNRIAAFANSANRIQEYLIRGGAMEFRMRTLLARTGKDFDKINPADIPQDVMEASIAFARHVTFASQAKSGTALASFIRGWSELKVPLLINPFPQFTFKNFIPFIFHKSTGGVFKMLSKDGRAAAMKLFSKDAMSVADIERAQSFVADASIGGLLWSSAWNIRQREHDLYPDAKWNEIHNEDGSVVDARSYGPYSSFLFLSEVFMNGDKIKPADWADAFMGLGRLGGTPLIVSDLIRAKDTYTFKKLLLKMAGAVIGGFSTPLRQARDIIEFDVSPEDAILRDTRQDPILGPFLNNVPIMQATLPAKYTPLYAGERDLNAPKHRFEFLGRSYEMNSLAHRQLTGLSQSHKTRVQYLVDKLDIDMAVIYPRTGNAEADNLVAKGQGYFMATVVDGLLRNGLENQPEPVQRLLMRRMFAASKAYGRALLDVTHPRLGNELRALGEDKDMMQIMEEFGGINPYQAADEELLKRGYAAPKEQRAFIK